MQISFYCNHCHRHLRSGDHSECRKAMRASRKNKSEESRLATGERTRQRYANGTMGEALAKLEKSE